MKLMNGNKIFINEIIAEIGYTISHLLYKCRSIGDKSYLKPGTDNKQIELSGTISFPCYRFSL